MPASLISGPHLSISALRMAASSSGVEPRTTTPRASSFCLVAGSVSAATVSACILRMISGGVFAGTKKAYQDETSKPGTPTSAIGGSSGAAGVRLAVVTARPRNLPPWISGSPAAIGHVQHLDAGHALEQLAGEMHRRAVAGGSERYLASVGLGVGDEICDR